MMRSIQDIAGLEVETKSKFCMKPSRDTSPYHCHQSTNVNTISNFQNNHMKDTFNTTLNNNYMGHSKNNSRIMNETQNYQTSYDLFKTNAMHIKQHGSGQSYYMNNTNIKDAFGRDETAAQTGNYKSFADDYNNGKMDSDYENNN